MPSAADSLRTYVARRPEMFLRVEISFECHHAVADVRCGFRAGPAPWWRERAVEGGEAIERAAAHALDYWGWRQATRHA
jgi:hypothetical protein